MTSTKYKERFLKGLDFDKENIWFSNYTVREGSKGN